MKKLTNGGLSNQALVYLILCVGMIAAGIYLTNHFFEIMFPKGITDASGGLCDLNSFWSCDHTTKSKLGQIAHIPTSIFGLLMGVIGIIGFIFSSDEMERTLKFSFLVNAIGCLGLLIYSLVALGGLCPVCTIYYVLSWGVLFLFHKFSDSPYSPAPKQLALFAVIVLIPSFIMRANVSEKVAKQGSLSSQYISQYKGLKQVGDPVVDSEFHINKLEGVSFKNAPLRLSIFSDFQCPFCKVVSSQAEKLKETFKDKLAIQYFFWPLDMNCNPAITRAFHDYACMAAKLAACDPSKFLEIHDFVFAHQKDLSNENIKNWSKKFALDGKNCFESNEVNDKIMATISAGDQYNIKSTPTLIINGKKIEGTIPTIHIEAIFNDILKNK
jgi:protein-disulfide isomerase/uncharacterized membrane protein